MTFLRTESFALPAEDLISYAVASYDRIHTQDAIKQRGEIFTPTPLVNEMLDKLPIEVFTDKSKI